MHLDDSLQTNQINEREAFHFQQYLQNIYTAFPHDPLNNFEHSLDVWREVWRVTELSDVVRINRFRGNARKKLHACGIFSV